MVVVEMSMVSSWSMRTVMMIRHGMADVVDVVVVDKSRKLVVVDVVADVVVVIVVVMEMIVHF